VLGAYVEGDILGFTFVALDGGVRSVRARVDGGSLAGSLNFAGNLTPLTGQRTGHIARHLSEQLSKQQR